MNDYSSIETLKSERALSAIANASQFNPIILDFDQTLLLRNSTAEYLDSLRPRFLGFTLITLLKVIQPWRWLPRPFGGKKTRDWYLVVTPTILLPWTLSIWRRKAKQLAQKHGNLQIISAVNNNPDGNVIVASLGFNFIIEPVLNYLPLKYNKLSGCRFWQGAYDRNLDKLIMVQKVLSNSEIKSAILVTDSRDDLPLLEAVEQPCLCLWSSATYVKPFHDFWLYRLLQKLNTPNALNSKSKSQDRAI